VSKVIPSTLALTSVLDGVGGQRHTLAALTPGKTWYPLYRRLGGPQPVCTGLENLAPTGIWYPDYLARSESLYGRRYPGSRCGIILMQYYAVRSYSYH